MEDGERGKTVALISSAQIIFQERVGIYKSTVNKLFID
jgi:hypothetical protein